VLDKALLMNELRQWSRTVLEKPQEKFNNLPACPHAKKTWDNNKVNVVISECEMWSDLMDYIINFDDTYDVIIYCGDNYENITADEVDTRINLLNKQVNRLNLYVMGSHPDTEIEFATEQSEFMALFEDDYYQIFVQRLDVLIKASDNIIKKGYYKNYSNQQYQSQILNRKNYER
jgi:hypothetical protein